MNIIIFQPQPQPQAGACGVKDVSLELVSQAAQQGWASSIHEYYGSDYPVLSAILPNSGDVLVILQFVFFGSHKYGLPWQMIDFSKRIRVRSNVSSVFCIHELPQVAGNRLVRSLRAYLQWEIAKRIARNVDAVIINQMGGQCLRDRHNGPPVFLPAFSNVGELATFDPMQERDIDLVVFGTPVRRQRAYERLCKLNSHCIGGRAIRSIADIGPPIEIPASLESKFSIRKYGLCPKQHVSEILAASWAGLFSAPPGQATKAGVLAAYCAHGVLPINVEEPISGFTDAELAPFIYLNDLPMDALEVVHIRCKAFDWSRQYPINERLVRFINAAKINY